MRAYRDTNWTKPKATRIYVVHCSMLIYYKHIAIALSTFFFIWWAPPLKSTLPIHHSSCLCRLFFTHRRSSHHSCHSFSFGNFSSFLYCSFFISLFLFSFSISHLSFDSIQCRNAKLNRNICHTQFIQMHVNVLSPHAPHICICKIINQIYYIQKHTLGIQGKR